MGQIIQNIYEWIAALFNKSSLEILKKTIQPYTSEFTELHFSFTNPVFVLLVLLTLLILSKIWGLRKAFFYCLIVSLTLCLATMINIYPKRLVGETVFTSVDIRAIVSLVIISIVTFFFLFLKK